MFGLVFYSLFMIDEEDIGFSGWTLIFSLTMECETNLPSNISPLMLLTRPLDV